jgi:phosphatidylserine/phosphatidylglycerophosphate/cardiolipin synthase-like enzyme
LSCLREPSNKLGDLYENDIAVFICMPERKGAKSSLMHNKFILFEKNIYGRKIVWTGSANMTRSALTEIHHENVVILDDISLYQEYEKKFAQLKKRSERYEDCTITNAALHDRIRTSENSKKNTQTRAKAHTIA